MSAFSLGFFPCPGWFSKRASPPAFRVSPNFVRAASVRLTSPQLAQSERLVALDAIPEAAYFPVHLDAFLPPLEFPPCQTFPPL